MRQLQGRLSYAGLEVFVEDAGSPFKDKYVAFTLVAM